MRQIDTEIEVFRERERQAAHAREEFLRAAQSRQATLATSFADLLGDGGPADETADDMIRTIRGWRDTSSNRSLD
jgi:hypothetical protein